MASSFQRELSFSKVRIWTTRPTSSLEDQSVSIFPAPLSIPVWHNFFEIYNLTPIIRRIMWSLEKIKKAATLNEQVIIFPLELSFNFSLHEKYSTSNSRFCTFSGHGFLVSETVEFFKGEDLNHTSNLQSGRPEYISFSAPLSIPVWHNFFEIYNLTPIIRRIMWSLENIYKKKSCDSKRTSYNFSSRIFI